MGAINISNVGKVYPNGTRALEDVNIEINDGEFVVLVGPSGCGKTTLLRMVAGLEDITEGEISIADNVVNEVAPKDRDIAMVFQNYALYPHMSVYDNMAFSLKLRKLSKEEIDNYFDILYNGNNENRVWIHAHFGTNSIEDIFSKLRYMIVGCGCKWVVIDHLHMLVSAMYEGDERRAIDAIMTKLRSICEETGAGMLLVSHLRRVDGNKGHENGIQVSLSHLRGSQSIAQLSDCVIALERNQQAEDEQESNTTQLRVLKSRYTGDVGLACKLLYDRDTGRLHEVPLEDYEDDGQDIEFDAYA